MRQLCKFCGKNEGYSNTIIHNISIDGQVFSGMLTADLCNACHTTTPNADHLAAFELSVAYLCLKLNLVSPEAFKFMREAINTSVNTMAGYTGVTAETIQKWENGSVQFGPGAFAVLRIYVKAEFNRQNIYVWANNQPNCEVHCSPKLK